MDACVAATCVRAGPAMSLHSGAFSALFTVRADFSAVLAFTFYRSYVRFETRTVIGANLIEYVASGFWVIGLYVFRLSTQQPEVSSVMVISYD